MLRSWGIPWLSLSRTSAEVIVDTASSMDPPPRVLLSSISRVADKEVQKAIRRLNIRVIAIDEAQVADPDPKAGWGEFLPYKLEAIITSSHHHIITSSHHHIITASQHPSITASHHHSITASHHSIISTYHHSITPSHLPTATPSGTS